MSAEDLLLIIVAYDDCLRRLLVAYDAILSVLLNKQGQIDIGSKLHEFEDFTPQKVLYIDQLRSGRAYISTRRQRSSSATS